MINKFIPLLLIFLFLLSGALAFEGEDIELTNENIIGLAFSSMDNGE